MIPSTVNQFIQTLQEVTETTYIPEDLLTSLAGIQFWPHDLSSKNFTWFEKFLYGSNKETINKLINIPGYDSENLLIELTINGIEIRTEQFHDLINQLTNDIEQQVKSKLDYDERQLSIEEHANDILNEKLGNLKNLIDQLEDDIKWRCNSSNIYYPQITSYDQFVVGQTYWLKNKETGTFVTAVCEGEHGKIDSTVPVTIKSHWITKDNHANTFLKYDFYGPIPQPLV